MTTSNNRSAVTVDPSSFLGEFLAIGVPSEETIREGRKGSVELAPVTVGPRCIIKNFVTLSEGTSLDADVVVEDHCRLGANVRIGSRTRLIYGAYICDAVTIGTDCRVAGFICDDVVIENSCTVMGELVHAYNQPHRGWWDVDEPAPSVRHDSIVAFSSTVIGAVTIGPYSYVAGGTLVTRDVPSWHVAVGHNRFVPWRDWRGPALQGLFSYWASLDGSLAT